MTLAMQLIYAKGPVIDYGEGGGGHKTVGGLLNFYSYEKGVGDSFSHALGRHQNSRLQLKYSAGNSSKLV